MPGQAPGYGRGTACIAGRRGAGLWAPGYGPGTDSDGSRRSSLVRGCSAGNTPHSPELPAELAGEPARLLETQPAGVLSINAPGVGTIDSERRISKLLPVTAPARCYRY